ncbi:hypothetical protein [Pseudomonas sp.]|uniref:hypothetical protein n=1 Tax=Pseudomonas sp. TaxID=306 RepID=UPI00260CD94F|nr:hypothetical protein [Pseudomonas sp.]
MTVIPFPVPDSPDDCEATSRSGDRPTSHAAGKNTRGRESITMQLLRIYADAMLNDPNHQGFTDEEAMKAAGFSLEDDGHRRRCSTLRERRYIEQWYVNGIGVERLNERTGKFRIVCIVTTSGIDRLWGRT